MGRPDAAVVSTSGLKFPLWSRLITTTTTTTDPGNSLGGTTLRAFDFGFIDCSLEAKCKQRALQLLTAFSNTMSSTNTSATGMISNFSSALSSPTGLTSPSISRPSFPLFGTREVHDSRYVPAKGHPLVREAIPIHYYDDSLKHYCRVVFFGTINVRGSPKN